MGRFPRFEELNEYISRKWRINLLALSCVTSEIVWKSIQISTLYIIVPMPKNMFILINVSFGPQIIVKWIILWQVKFRRTKKNADCSLKFSNQV
jgi:biotin transporter BioY